MMISPLSPPPPPVDAGVQATTSVRLARIAAAPAWWAAAVLRSAGLVYVDGIQNGPGPVRISDIGGSRYVRFEDVMLTNAPDVHVYLSRETGGKWDAATSLYLGTLKATNGSFNYDLPADIDVASYRSVVVSCRALRALITGADLREGPACAEHRG